MHDAVQPWANLRRLAAPRARKACSHCPAQPGPACRAQQSSTLGCTCLLPYWCPTMACSLQGSHLLILPQSTYGQCRLSRCPGMLFGSPAWGNDMLHAQSPTSFDMLPFMLGTKGPAQCVDMRAGPLRVNVVPRDGRNPVVRLL